MISSMLAFAALAIQAQAADPEANAPEMPQLSISAQAALRCSAAFALVSYGQERGDPASMQWPQVDPEGREFFVQSIARIMDETGIDRDQAATLAEIEAKRLLDSSDLEAIMPSCLALLEASGI